VDVTQAWFANQVAVGRVLGGLAGADHRIAEKSPFVIT
jgi:hypothetical protein